MTKILTIKIKKMIDNANEFYEAAKRCSFSTKSHLGVVTEHGVPLLLPNLVNLSFACELYLKAIFQTENHNTSSGHKLRELFLNLDAETQNSIYQIWLKIDENDIVDCNSARKIFNDNLESISDYFVKFRYEHEWGGSAIGSWLHLGVGQSHLIGNNNIYNGFLLQFANSLRELIATM